MREPILLKFTIAGKPAIDDWWTNLAKTPARVQTPAPVTRALQANDGKRVYTRFDLYIDDTADMPRVDAPSVPALYGLHNVAGSEPLVLERYSRALGNVGPDAVNELPGNPPPDSLYNDNSHVLDILNTGTIATFNDLRSTPMRSNPQRWRIEPLGNEVLLLHNNRALPRAWLVTHAEAVDSEEALRRIRGESARHFDPRSLALLEVAQQDLPALPGGVLMDGKAEMTDYRNNQLRIETSASTATVLVVSEIFYPGWEATIDGKPAPIMLTDYLLRGVALPAGNHVVEMRYMAPQARNGAIITIISLLICAMLTARALLVQGRPAAVNVDSVHPD